MHFAYSRGVSLMAGPFDDLVGELQPGDFGWLPLDEAGNPTGPATIEPPPAPALACSVKHNDQEAIDEGADALVSSAGATLNPPLQNNPDRRMPSDGEPPPPNPPSISLLNPSTAPLGADLALVVSGVDLDGATDVTVNGVASPATGVTGTSVSTTVLAATLVEGAASVTVTTPAGVSNALSLTVTPVLEDQVDALKRRHRVGEDDPISTSPKRK
jgi:hypothetical protein